MDLRKLKLIYFHSTEIKKDDILWGLLELEIDAVNPPYQVHCQVYEEQEVQEILAFLDGMDAVMTQDFSASVAEACHRKNKPYISWVYDSPQRALYMKEAKYGTNHIFCFDKVQIERLRKIGVQNLYYSPLASNITKTSTISISGEDEKRFHSDLSFVGNLYNRAAIRDFIEKMPEILHQRLLETAGRHMFRWNGESVFGSFDDSLISYVEAVMSRKEMGYYAFDREYLSEILILMPYLSMQERIGMLDTLSSVHRVDLYTGDFSSETGLDKVILHPAVKEPEMYKIFYCSKINLNMTMRGIESGIPQRVFDIMSVGGFVLSNFQPEIPELFEIGKEIEVFHDLEELKDKALYYLLHERERLGIGIAGYQKVKHMYSYPQLVKQILERVFC